MFAALPALPTVTLTKRKYVTMSMTDTYHNSTSLSSLNIRPTNTDPNPILNGSTINISDYEDDFPIGDNAQLISVMVAGARGDKLVREFVHNAVTAAAKLPSPNPVKILALRVNGVKKLAFWNKSEPLDRAAAKKLLGTFSASGQITDASGKLNFGIGARITGLRFNPYGLVYQFCANGDAFELRFEHALKNGRKEYRPKKLRTLSDAELAAYGCDRLSNWVMAILMGESAQHNTVSHPFGLRKKVNINWLQNDLLRRYYTLSPNIDVQIANRILGIPNNNLTIFTPLNDFILKLQDMVNAPTGFTPGVDGAWQTIGPIAFPDYGNNVTAEIEYVWTGNVDAPLGAGLTLAGKSPPSIEIYNAKFGNRWANKAFNFGVFNGSWKRAMILIHLNDPDDELTIETNRENIKDKNGDHLNVNDFAKDVVDHMPKWFTELVQANIAPTSNRRSQEFFEKQAKKFNLTTDIWQKAKQGQTVATGNIAPFRSSKKIRTPGSIPNPNPNKTPKLQPQNNTNQNAQSIPQPLTSPTPTWPDAASLADSNLLHTIGVFSKSSNTLFMNEHHPQYVEYINEMVQCCRPIPEAFIKAELRTITEKAAYAGIIAALRLVSKGATEAQFNEMTGPPVMDDDDIETKRHNGMALTMTICATLNTNDAQNISHIKTTFKISSQQTAKTNVTT
jgi:hypothetical protein